MDEQPKYPFFIRDFFHEYFDLRKDKDDEKVIVESIRNGVSFRGANLWILIFAIFVASLGLNVNSTAVIIGAMLISPLMGPIIGMGLAVGINDFELLKRSIKNFAVATVISVVTATIYFSLTPINEAQSELLARTSPTIYDVLIALFGGLAGIVALSTKDKGNVLPGVAIATALMPPLCTAGYGLATGQLIYFLGAFYLYFINSVFISLATFLGTRFLHFSKKQFVDKAREKKVKNYIIGLVVITMCPAIFMTYSIVQSTIYNSNASEFINNELNFANTQVINQEIDYKKKSIRIVLVGSEVDETQLAHARDQLKAYKLQNTKLNIIQGVNSDSVDVKSLRSLVMEDFYKDNVERSEKQKAEIAQLRNELQQYTQYSSLDQSIIPELKVLYPNAASISLSYAIETDVETQKKDTLTLAFMRFSPKPKASEQAKITEWLKARTGASKLKLIIE